MIDEKIWGANSAEHLRVRMGNGLDSFEHSLGFEPDKRVVGRLVMQVGRSSW
jgi:hypothetical protein